MNELELVVLTHAIADHKVEQGDVGTIVHRYQDGQAYEVEFVTAAGATVAILNLTGADVRPPASREILHVRELAPTS